MTGYIIAMIPPAGPAEYWPEGFGYTCHAHTTDKAAAKRFPDKAAAGRVMTNYRHPPAFWNSEIRHARRMEEHFRGWKFEVQEVTQ